MEAYKFNTKVSKNGAIKLPPDAGLSDKEVEVIILLKESKRKQDFKAIDFIEKWPGILKNDRIDDAKFNYLSEKYK